MLVIGILWSGPVFASPAISDSSPGMHLHIATPAYQLSAEGLAVPGYAVNDAPGAPALPVWRTVVELPPTGQWSLRFKADQTLQLRAPAALPAVPVPDISPLGPESLADYMAQTTATPMVDRPDPSIYQANVYYPQEPVAAGVEQWQRGRRLLPVQVFPFQYNPITGDLRYYPVLDVVIEVDGQLPGQPAAPGPLEPATSIKSATPDTALRLRVPGRGLYRLTYDDLNSAGVPLAAANPDLFTVTYEGQPVDIQVTGAGDGSFDPGDLVIFYAVPYEGRYQTDNVYWFSYGGAAGPRMAVRTVTPTGNEPVVTTITQTLHIENDLDYRSLYQRTQDADHWFDSQLSVNTAVPTATTVYPLALDDALTSGNLQVRALVHGGMNQAPNPDQSLAIRLNSHVVDTFQWEGSTDYLAQATAPATWLDGAPNQLSLQAALSQLPALSSYWVSPDWVEVTYPALADAEDDRIYVEGAAPGANKVEVTGFSSAAVSVYDVRNPQHPVQLGTTQALPAGGAYTVSFWDAALPAPSYFLSANAALVAPLAIERNDADAASVPSPADWLAPAQGYDYIAVVHPSFWDPVQPLLDHRAAEGLRVAKINVQDIYDEYSFGRRDPEAIRSFLSYAYHHWNGASAPPEYVLLVGDGHYDFTGVSGTTMPNLIPPYLAYVDPWIGEAPADNRYASVDGSTDYLPDMAIGRIPAREAADVTAVVNKILAYEDEALAPGDAWQQRAVFVADNCADTAGNFHNMSDQIRLGWLPAQYQSQTLYFGNPAQCPGSTSGTDTGPEMLAAIQSSFESGALMLQWFGHASRFRWGTTRVFSNADVPNQVVNNKWPVTFSYSCWSGYFVNLAFLPIYNNDPETLGEQLVVTPERGSIADVSPAGQHIGDALLVLNQGMVKAIFQDRIDRFGLAVDAGKYFFYANSFSWHDIIDTSIAFGDPALKLRLPQKPKPPQVAVSRLGADVRLTWPHVTQDVENKPVTVSAYQVWRSTAPYFAPGDAGAMQIAAVPAPVNPGDPLVFDDGQAIGDPAIDYFYIVRAVSASTWTSDLSNRVAEFDFEVTPGS